ncbi:MAG: hypothetical protein JWQ25_1977 [Daejeonella sp.]|nr:hypothetical protein [Daejeonella sp.]
MKLTNSPFKLHMPHLHVPQVHLHVPHIHMNQAYLPEIPSVVERSIFYFLYAIMVLFFLSSFIAIIVGIYERGF